MWLNTNKKTKKLKSKYRYTAYMRPFNLLKYADNSTNTKKKKENRGCLYCPTIEKFSYVGDNYIFLKNFLYFVIYPNNNSPGLLVLSSAHVLCSDASGGSNFKCVPCFHVLL